MIDGLKPYPTMKDSEVPWLGEVPEHWEVARNGRLFTQRNETGHGELPILEVSQKAGVRIRTLGSAARKQVMSDKEKYKRARAGDIAYNMMRMWQGAVGTAPVDGLVSPAYVVAKPAPGTNSAYYEHLYRLPAYMGEVNLRSRGIVSDRNRLYWADFKQIVSPLPPPKEQAAIAGFLDHADRRIRRYLRAKKKLIELLEEQRQGVINHAVTRGLDPRVRLKPSGLEWLGDIPEHWTLQRLKSLVTRVTSGSRGWSDYAADSGPLFIRIGNLTRSSIDLDLADAVHLKLPDSALSEAARTRVRPNDILLSITAFIGSVAVVPAWIEESYISQHVACCRLREEAVNPRWAAYLLLSVVGQTHGQLSMYGGTKQGLSLDDVKNYVLVLPPRDQQDCLVGWIDWRCSDLVAASKRAQQTITLLREYRTRLIADVVTGKLDVREAAVQLPPEPDESEEVDEADEPMAEDDDEPADPADLPDEAAE